MNGDYLEVSSPWLVFECERCGMPFELLTQPFAESMHVCPRCRKKEQDERDTDQTYPLSRAD